MFFAYFLSFRASSRNPVGTNEIFRFRFAPPACRQAQDDSQLIKRGGFWQGCALKNLFDFVGFDSFFF